MNEAGDVSLLSLLDSSQLNCLNESHLHSLSQIVASKGANTSTAFLLSDLDEQLLLTIPFNQPVRIRSLVFKSSEASHGPKVVKLLVNRQSIDFADVQDVPESQIAQVLTLTEDQVKEGKRVPLRFVRFQNVSSLHIFVESNQGDEDTTRIDVLDVLGLPVEATKDLIGLQKQDDD